MKLLWLDLETTGLDHRRDLILEIAMMVTEDMTPVESFDQVVRYSWSDVKRLSPDVVWEMHDKSGLLADLQHPTRSVESYYVWQAAAAFSQKHFPGGVPMIAGCGVDFDRRMLDWSYQSVGVTVLGTKLLDVSSVRRAAKLFGIELPERPKAHRAMADIMVAQEELKELVHAIKVGVNHDGGCKTCWQRGFDAGIRENNTLIKDGGGPQ